MSLDSVLDELEQEGFWAIEFSLHRVWENDPDGGFGKLVPGPPEVKYRVQFGHNEVSWTAVLPLRGTPPLAGPTREAAARKLLDWHRARKARKGRLSFGEKEHVTVEEELNEHNTSDTA